MSLDTQSTKRANLNTPSMVALLLIVVGCSSGGGDDASVTARTIRAESGVLSGEIIEVRESRGIFKWGDSLNFLCQQWSVALFDRSGWFYGSGYSWSSADVYVLEAPNDPLSIVDAENFDYTTGSVQAAEGDTVFFRGRNGFFGAWTIDLVDGQQGALLSGTWYFKAGGGGDFTGAITDGGSSTYDVSTGGC